MRKKEPDRTLLERLTRELFQTEMSASQHCRREAERLGTAAGAEAFRAIAEHADEVLRVLPGLARSHRLPKSPGGALVGATFSRVRDLVADKLIDRERSYRGTILGLRHGVDVVRLFGTLAERSGHDDLGRFRDAWLDLRLPLIARVEEGLLWFADHPDIGLGRATAPQRAS